MVYLTKKTGEIAVGAVFVAGAIFLFSQSEYGWGVLLTLALLVLLKIDALTEFAFSISDGMRAKFATDPEKIEQEIRENEEPVTNRNFASFRHVETRILAELQRRYGGKMKTRIHFMYGAPDEPQFYYTPDGSLQTEDALYFFEIKNVLKPELAKRIIEQAATDLKTVYDAFSPATGKRLVIKLILASSHDIDTSRFTVPKGIELEFFKV